MCSPDKIDLVEGTLGTEGQYRQHFKQIENSRIQA